MRATRIAGFGDPEVLQPVECEEPAPRAGWAVVELRAAGLNWHDCLVRQGAYPTVPLPLTLGADGAGVRRDTGEEVIIFPSLHWGADERHPGANFEILGDFTDGTYAELVAVPTQNLFLRPAGWSWSEAAALGLGGATAYRAMVSRGGLAADETVLVLGAGSGVSTIAVALARMAGARVFVTSSSPEKLARAAELGAAGGALYTEEDWPDRIRELAAPHGVDLVVDSAGATWPQSLGVLAPGGRLVSFGATAGDEATVAVRPFYFGQFSILGSTMGSPRDFAGLLGLLGRDTGWRPAIDSVYPLERAAEAHTQMERREHFGKLVLTIGED
ncbi:MAG TPA: zinc-binding dehydrogenase [Solirubrobacteraceae bacterium]|jgi:NADPH:quinone reductase-like Zn-dependent oxidoreductase